MRTKADFPGTGPNTAPGVLHGLAGKARAFTLVEMVVAVGAVALVAVGLASIFDAVGKTVTGGKRLSVLNPSAPLADPRPRRAFKPMSRDGSLVTPQQYVARDADGKPAPAAAVPAPATNPDAVPLPPEQQAVEWRTRRV